GRLFREPGPIVDDAPLQQLLGGAQERRAKEGERFRRGGAERERDIGRSALCCEQCALHGALVDRPPRQLAALDSLAYRPGLAPASGGELSPEPDRQGPVAAVEDKRTGAGIDVRAAISRTLVELRAAI